jgi:hypothetical protein
MVTDRNPYAPPAADVVLPAQKTAAPSKRSLLPLWLSALYCLITGAGSLVALVLVTYRLRNDDVGAMLGWGFAIGILHPIARFAAGISLIRRARIAPQLCVALIVVTVAGPILWRLYVALFAGRSFGYSSPNILLAIGELLLLLVITRYAFALRSAGMLQPPRPENSGMPESSRGTRPKDRDFEFALIGRKAHWIRSLVHDPASSRLVLSLTDDVDSSNPTRQLEFLEIEHLEITWTDRNDDCHEGLLGAHEEELPGFVRYLLATEQREISVTTRQKARMSESG